jgi:hypothetical protein
MSGAEEPVVRLTMHDNACSINEILKTMFQEAGIQRMLSMATMLNSAPKQIEAALKRLPCS